ncbi:MAG: iron chaperone [Candidatus Limnocylindrales bacterium]
MTDTKATSKRTRTTRTSRNVWTDEERAAMQESARERKAASRRSPGEERAAGEQEVRAKIAEMPAPDRAMAERIHALVTESAPDFVPRTYYGMPAYARDGKVICFFQAASKFKVRYSTFGFQPDARVDDGEMWPVAFAVTKLTAGVEARIAELVKKAAG